MDERLIKHSLQKDYFYSDTKRSKHGLSFRFSLLPSWYTNNFKDFSVWSEWENIKNWLISKTLQFINSVVCKIQLFIHENSKQ